MITALTIVIIVCAVVGGLATLWKTYLEGKVDLWEAGLKDKKYTQMKSWEKQMKATRPPKIKIRKIK